jgi:hypothetical protein
MKQSHLYHLTDKKEFEFIKKYGIRDKRTRANAGTDKKEIFINN